MVCIFIFNCNLSIWGEAVSINIIHSKKIKTGIYSLIYFTLSFYILLEFIHLLSVLQYKKPNTLVSEYWHNGGSIIFISKLVPIFGTIMINLKCIYKN